jgi:hypothetical protein
LAFAATCLAGAAYAEQRSAHGEDSKGLWQINAKDKTAGAKESRQIGGGELQHSRANKADGFTAKQKAPRAFHPKEFKLDKKGTWKASPKIKAPKIRTLCTTPDGKPRAC